MNTEYESGSSWLVRGFSNLALLALASFAFYAHRRWPDEGDFSWKLGHAVGAAMDDTGIAILAAGVLCATVAATLQLIRVLFRMSRR